MRKNMKMLLALALALFMVCPLALAENTEAPRAYFPYHSELENLPEPAAAMLSYQTMSRNQEDKP